MRHDSTLVMPSVMPERDPTPTCRVLQSSVIRDALPCLQEADGPWRECLAPLIAAHVRRHAGRRNTPTARAGLRRRIRRVLRLFEQVMSEEADIEPPHLSQADLREAIDCCLTLVCSEVRMVGYLRHVRDRVIATRMRKDNPALLTETDSHWPWQAVENSLGLPEHSADEILEALSMEDANAARYLRMCYLLQLPPF